MKSDFFEKRSYFVDKKNSLQNYCDIYNDKNEYIGVIKESLNAQQKLLRMVFGKSFLPFSIEIRNSDGSLESSISRQGIFFLSDIIVRNAQGEKVGVLSKGLNFSKPEFKILNASHKVIAGIGNAWKGTNFMVTDPAENQIGSIDKKRRFIKSILASPKSYNVSMMSSYSNNEEKVAILSSAIVVNMFFFN